MEEQCCVEDTTAFTRRFFTAGKENFCICDGRLVNTPEIVIGRRLMSQLCVQTSLAIEGFTPLLISGRDDQSWLMSAAEKQRCAQPGPVSLSTSISQARGLWPLLNQ